MPLAFETVDGRPSTVDSHAEFGCNAIEFRD